MFKKYIRSKVKNKKLAEVLEWSFALAIALLCAYLIRQFVVIDFVVFGDSMTPTLSHSDRLLINRMAYTFKAPDYGDIIVFPYKKNPEKKYVKRVVGLPGDVIEYEFNEFYINGELLDDEFSEGYISLLGNIEFPVTVPEGTYFVLGDNRNASEDSRSYDVGFIERNKIIGAPLLRFYPVSDIGFIR